MQAIDNEESDHRCFFLDGPSRSGKTFLYNTLMNVRRDRDQIVIPVASIDVSATLLKLDHNIPDLNFQSPHWITPPTI
jgi:hypothetical protein